MVSLVSVNVLAVIVAALAQFFIGWIWHGPLFGKAWMHEMGMKPNPKMKMSMMMPSMIGALIGALVMSYVVAQFVAPLGVVNFAGAMQFAFWAWLGLFAVPLAGRVFWEQKTWKLFAITSGYWLVVLGVSSWLLAVWH
jgi:hypothetical protein